MSRKGLFTLGTYRDETMYMVLWIKGGKKRPPDHSTVAETGQC